MSILVWESNGEGNCNFCTRQGIKRRYLRIETDNPDRRLCLCICHICGAEMSARMVELLAIMVKT